MAKKKHNKLVRDKIPEKIIALGMPFKAHVISEDDYLRALGNKLLEESKEVNVALNDYLQCGVPDRGLRFDLLMEELADTWTVWETLARKLGISVPAMKSAIDKKNNENGKLEKGIFLEWVDDDASKE